MPAQPHIIVPATRRAGPGNRPRRCTLIVALLHEGHLVGFDRSRRAPGQPDALYVENRRATLRPACLVPLPLS